MVRVHRDPCFIVIVVPLFRGWQVNNDFEFKLGFFGFGLPELLRHFGCDQQVLSKHKLLLQVKGMCIHGELLVHRPHNGTSVLGGQVESSVKVVEQTIPQVQG